MPSVGTGQCENLNGGVEGMNLGPYELNSIITGDCKELAKAIPDESVDLIFTDPVYQNIDDYRWLAETAARVLKPEGSLLAYAGHIQQIEAAAVMLPYLNPRPILITWMSPPYPRLWSCKMHVNYSFVLWFTRDKKQPLHWIMGELGQAYQNKNFGHMWGKNLGAIQYYLLVFTHPGATVFDPFTGGGTVPAVCKMLGRNYLAFEIDPQTADLARQCVLDTQPPLFVMAQPEQLELMAV
jgi:DNA modification methylase